MRRAATVLLLALAASACTDSTAPYTADGVPVHFSISGPELVSQEETAALAAAFDRVDSYTYEVVDSATFEAIAAGTIAVTPGSPVHALDINVPDEAVGRSVQITLIAFDGEMELYRSVVYTTLTGDVGSIRVDAQIRYTGPGIRGTIRTTEGAPVEGVPVTLAQDQSIIGTALTQEDGTYLFVDSRPVRIRSSRPLLQGSQVCPVFRGVTITRDDGRRPGHRLPEHRAGICGTRVLVLSGGDFDETRAGSGLPQYGSPTSTADTTFFFVNQPPSSSTSWLSSTSSCSSRTGSSTSPPPWGTGSSNT